MTALFPLTLAGATARRRGKLLVGPIDLTLGPAGCTVVIGPNGSGKTTFLGLMHGTVRLASGSIQWNTDAETARSTQAFVFQRPVMLRRSVLENLIYPLRIRGVDLAAAKALANDWAGRVGLADMLDHPASVLSGGEQQKLAVSRALITKPQLLFLDEPCAALDGRSTREIEDILGDARTTGTRIILSTHDMGQARRLADDVVFLKSGVVEEFSSADTFFSAPQSPHAGAFLRGEIVE